MMLSSSVLSKPLYTMGFANPPSPLGKDLVLTVSSVYSRGDWLSRSLRVVDRTLASLSPPTPTGLNYNLKLTALRVANVLKPQFIYIADHLLFK